VVKATPGRSRVLRAAIVVAALVAVGGGLWLSTLRRDPSRELDAATGAFLARVTGGKASEAYAQGADELHAKVDHGVFQLVADDLVEAAGPFVRIDSLATKIEPGAAGAGEQADVVAQVAFAKRRLPVHLGLVRKDGEGGWRVSSFVVMYPDSMWPAPDAAAVSAESTRWMEQFRADDKGAMYARLYPDAWATWKPSKFDADITRLQNSCQDMQIGTPAIEGTTQEADTVVDVPYVCRNGDHVVTRMHWMWLRGKWRLLKVSWAVPKLGEAEAGQGAPGAGVQEAPAAPAAPAVPAVPAKTP
jgi:hypothetical protein